MARILSDYHLTGFNGLRALTICQKRAPAIPSIFVTGAMGEELAVASIYPAGGNRLHPQGPAWPACPGRPSAP